MSRRLYLVDHDEYRVSHTDASVVRGRWDDATRTFVTGRGQQRRTIDMSTIAAVASCAHDGRATHRWYPLDSVFRAACRPASAPSTPKWVHPYARAAA